MKQFATTFSLIARASSLVLAIAAIAACGNTQQLPDDGFIDVPGGRVAFRVLGDGDSTPTLWIHGGPGGSSCFLVNHLSDIASERPAVLYDQLGGGFSDRIQDLDRLARLPRFVEEVTAIREELGLTELHLVGQSWGNAVALEYLLTRNPSGIKSVVFVSPYFGTEQWIADGKILLATLPPETQQAVAKAVEDQDFESDEFKAANRLYMENFVLRTPYDQLNLEACYKTPSGDSGIYDYMWGPAEFLMPPGRLRDYDRIDRLSELDLPVLFIAGQYDQARPETVRFYQSLVKGSSVVIVPDSSHAMFAEQTELFNKAVLDFLGEVDSQRR